MIKQNYYTYFGENGTVSTLVLLQGVPKITKVCLTADEGHILRGKETGVKLKTVTVSESQVDSWEEIPEEGEKD